MDDEPAICFAYRKLFESERFAFDICEDVDAAIDFLKTKDYFAVISDLRFAGVDNEDGIRLVSAARKELPQTEIILVTGYGNDEVKKTALALGASHYFEKPTNPSLILSLLRALHLVADKRETAEYFKRLSSHKSCT
ncbi:MAG: response regulator [Desulfuromonadaceae bacterium]|nr:response regulator [Desulfuromonadaceae bacterium]